MLDQYATVLPSAGTKRQHNRPDHLSHSDHYHFFKKATFGVYQIGLILSTVLQWSCLHHHTLSLVQNELNSPTIWNEHFWNSTSPTKRKRITWKLCLWKWPSVFYWQWLFHSSDTFFNSCVSLEELWQVWENDLISAWLWNILCYES